MLDLPRMARMKTDKNPYTTTRRFVGNQITTGQHNDEYYEDEDIHLYI